MGNTCCQDDLARTELMAPVRQTEVRSGLRNANPASETLQPPSTISKPPSHLKAPAQSTAVDSKSLVRNKDQPHRTFAEVCPQKPELNRNVNLIDQKLGEFTHNDLIQNKIGLQFTHIPQAYKLNNNTIYTGCWHEGQMQGPGQFETPEGEFIRGYSDQNKLIGWVRYIHPNGNWYQGQTMENAANGQGQLCQDGVIYQGTFVQNFLQGFGKEECEKYSFEGKYLHGSKTMGKLIWDKDKAIKSIYDGEFLNQKFHGRGKLINSKGEFDGTFVEGKKKGHGIFKWTTGEKFEGYYENDMKNGAGRLFNKNQVLVLEGIWKNDKFVEEKKQ